MGSGLTRFRTDLEQAGSVCLDAVVLIYHLEGLSPYVHLTSALIDLLAGARIRAMVSTVTVTEMLTRPYALGASHEARQVEEFLAGLPGTVVCPVDYEVARLGAELRGQYRLRTPDALVFATAVHHGAGALLTNEAGFTRAAGQTGVILLDSYLDS